MSLAELPLHAFERPATLAEACATLSRRAGKSEDTVLLAGGTDWIVAQHLAPVALGGGFPLVLDISRVPEIRGIRIARRARRDRRRGHVPRAAPARGPLAPRPDAHGHGARRGRAPDPGARHAGREPRDRLSRPRTAAPRSWPSTRRSSSRASTASGASRSPSGSRATGRRRAPPTRSSRASSSCFRRRADTSSGGRWGRARRSRSRRSPSRRSASTSGAVACGSASGWRPSRP